MGAWGIGYFENDGAGDVMAALRKAGDWSAVAEAFDIAFSYGDDYVDSPEGQGAIAAAAIVAAVKTGDMSGLIDMDRAAVAVLGMPAPELITQAIEAIARIRGPESELMDLWADTNETDDWLATLDKLESALKA